MKKYLTLQTLEAFTNAAVLFLLIKAGLSMLFQTEEMVNNFTFLHLLPYMILVGVLEIVGAAALTFGKTSLFGAVLISTIMGGAVALHLSCMNGAGVIFPIIVGILTWVTYYIKKYC
jgi:uncharacterized membrane protein